MGGDRHPPSLSFTRLFSESNMSFRLIPDHYAVVTGLAPITPSTSTPDYVSLKNVLRLTAVIVVDNGNTVTGSAITLKQATAVAGTSEKALAFSKAWRNIDSGAADGLTEFTVTSDTFTTDTTNAKNLVYVIDVDPASLDTNNGFDCVRVGTGDAANTVLSVLYLVQLRETGGSSQPSVIVD
jgi:hypothetical protein